MDYQQRIAQRARFMQAASTGDTAALATHLQGGFDINAQDWEGETGVMNAAFYNQPAALRLLLAAGADPDLPENQGGTPLIWAVRRNNVAAVQELVAGFADLRKTDFGGQTPLQAAETAQLPAMVRLLQEALAADPERRLRAALVLQKTLRVNKPFELRRNTP
jgi:ankyrin repeat protein